MSDSPPWPSRVAGAFLVAAASVQFGLLIWHIWTHRAWQCPKRPFQSSCKDSPWWRFRFSQIAMCRDVDKEDHDTRAKIEVHADAQRLERVRNLLQFYWFLVPVMVYRSLSNAQLLLQAEDNEYLVERARIVFYLPVEFMGLLFIIKPKCLTKSILRVAYVIVMLRGVYAAIVRNAEQSSAFRFLDESREMEVVTIHIFRLWFGLVLQDAPCLLLSHIFIVPLTILVYAVSSTNKKEAATEITQESILAMLVCVAGLSLERTTKAGIHASLQARSSKALQGAADTLLSSMCDAVVRLTKTYDLIQDCPRLSAMLLMDPSVPLTVNFCDLLMSDDDKETFVGFMRAGEQVGDSLAQTLHITLRDANKTPVHVQLFQTTCVGMDSEDAVHVVGVRDVGGERHAPVPEADQLAVHHQKVVLMPISEDSACGGSDSNTDTGSAWQTDISIGGEDVKVWISTFDLLLPIVKWTPAFANLVGPSSVSSGAPFVDLLPSRRGQAALTQELQDLSNQLLSDDAEAISPAVHFTIITPCLGTIAVLAHVELDMDSGEEEDEFVVVLDFQSWSRARGGRRRHSRTRSTSRRADPLPAATSATPAQEDGRSELKVSL